MKKYILIILTCLLIPSTVFASTDTYTRTYDDLRVNKSGISVSNSNIGIIMNTPSVNASEKIYDYADLLTDSEEEQLFELINQFITAYSTDFALVTIRENPYSKTEDDYSLYQDSYSMKFADDFYDYNDFGIGSDYTGVLFLIDMSNRYIWISSTGGAEQYFYYESVYDLLDYSYTYFTAGDYYKGIVESIYLMSGEYAHDLNYYTDGNYVTIKEKNAQSAGIITILVISTIATIIFVSVNMSKCKMAKIAKNAADYQRVIGVNIVNDILVNTSHTSHKISSDSGGYSGGGGHFSSSGSHHSGGGHHF